MKKNYKIILLILILTGFFLGFRQQQIAENKNKAILKGINRVLNYAHYTPKKIDDSLSVKIFNQFIEDIDPSKRYLLQEDIDTLSKYQFRIDDQILSNRLDFYKEAYEIILKRQKEVLSYTNEILDKGFNFDKKEILLIDYEKIDAAQNINELKERWRKYLKFNTLSRLYNKVKEEKQKKEKDTSYIPKTRKELEKEALEATRKSIKQFKEMLKDMDESDYFSMYINAITIQFDPHTNYFSPQVKERFDTSMSGSFEGIGARLQKEGDYVKIVEIIPGGPAWKDGVLKVGDLIQKVAQGEEEPVDIMGMRLSKVVKLIKGPKGTIVKLIVKRVDGSIETITITRDRVELEETFVKSILIKDSLDTFGYIYLPKFYINFNELDQRSASSDIKKELEKLKAEKVNGIILDLRNNGGGSLATVIDIVGYFIEEGPVVQVRDKHGKIDVLKDTDSHILYDGKLVILINELSASASEILAAALQDYNRAIIIGSNTYGKGTVQNIIELTRIEGDDFGDLGALKWTTKKFYRINGGSTQRKGVTPDIILPDSYMYLDVREESEPTSLPWDQIDKVRYKKYNFTNKSEIISKEQRRIDTLKISKYIKEKAYWLAQNQKDKTIYLNWDEYVADYKKSEAISKKYDSLIKFKSDLKFQSLTIDLNNHKNDTIFIDKRKKWIENLKKDFYVDEAVRVLKKM